MDLLIYSGAALTLVGLLAILYCLVAAVMAKRSNLSDEALRVRLRPLVPINLAAVMASILGLLCVVIGVMFNAG